MARCTIASWTFFVAGLAATVGCSPATDAQAPCSLAAVSIDTTADAPTLAAWRHVGALADALEAQRSPDEVARYFTAANTGTFPSASRWQQALEAMSAPTRLEVYQTMACELRTAHPTGQDGPTIYFGYQRLDADGAADERQFSVDVSTEWFGLQLTE